MGVRRVCGGGIMSIRGDGLDWLVSYVGCLRMALKSQWTLMSFRSKRRACRA
jgi:hypothetical protein